MYFVSKYDVYLTDAYLNWRLCFLTAFLITKHAKNFKQMEQCKLSCSKCFLTKYSFIFIKKLKKNLVVV